MLLYLDASSTKDVDRFRNVPYIGFCSKRGAWKKTYCGQESTFSGARIIDNIHMLDRDLKRVFFFFFFFFFFLLFLLMHLRWHRFFCPWRSICLVVKASAFLFEDLSSRHKVWQIAKIHGHLRHHFREIWTDVPREWQITKIPYNGVVKSAILVYDN